MNRRLRVLVPIVLSGWGFGMLSGCLFIPTFDKVVDGENVAKRVGNAESDRPVRVGQTTRDEVVRVLGLPSHASPDGRLAVYTWKVRNGLIVWPLCFQAYSQFGARGLELRFDPTGVLLETRLLKHDGNWYVNDVHGTPHLPKNLRPIQSMPGWPHVEPPTQPAPSEAPSHR